MTPSDPNSGTQPVYLCQISPYVSCGACCGLYNVADPSSQALEALLARRTQWFADVPRTVAGIDAFKVRVEASESQQRPFPDFHHCPFLGLIEDTGRRVGCLLHPLAMRNDGLDWRGLSYYGGMACRTYFCPSVRQLPARWLTVVRQSMDHWYLHGLMVTERQLLTTFFQAVEQRVGRLIEPADFSVGSDAATLFKGFAALKITWPYRRPRAAGPCNYFFEDGQYRRPALEAIPGDIAGSAAAIILRELDSRLASPEELRAAVATIEGIIQQIVHTIGK